MKCRNGQTDKQISTEQRNRDIAKYTNRDTDKRASRETERQIHRLTNSRNKLPPSIE